jgi:hypothetical protein
MEDIAVNSEMNQKRDSCALLQPKRTHQHFNAESLPHTGKRKSTKRLIERSERARQSTGAILAALIVVLVFVFQMS